ncbi:MAG: SH3 domain-containing protein [Actinomycetota bacterium]|nr:SH3 domain-containing protein [Actinomycetota bacterium]
MTKALGLGAAVMAAGVIGKVASVGAQEVGTANHTEEPYTVTSALNLRSGPGTSYRVVLVMPKGATVTLQQRYENGYYYVSYKGQLGWAHHDYIVKAGGTGDPVIIGTAVTTTSLNLRSGPSTSNQVLRVVAKGSTVKTSNTVRNGYRYVTNNGLVDRHCKA